MVDIRPFRAVRPNPRNKNDATAFICPPYDVISEGDHRALLKKSPNNVVRIELADGIGDDRFKNAERTLQEWRERGIFQEDRLPAFYLLETTYRIKDPFAPKRMLKRYGVLTALRLEPPGKGNVRPHEKTLPKAKEERLKLLRAVKTHVSPIFGLFLDEKKGWTAWVKKIVRKKQMVRGREHKMLSHALWKVDNLALQKNLQAILRGKDLFIADGHHRYEVAWAFKEEELVKNPQLPLTSGVNYVMAYICPMEEAGLLMLPTHRLVLSDKSITQWREHLQKFFEIQPFKSATALVDALSKRKSNTRILGWVTAEGSFGLVWKPDISLPLCLPNRPSVLRELDVVILHDLVMEEAAGKTYQKDKDLIYSRDLSEISALIRKDPRWTCFMLSSSGVSSLARVAQAGEVMPPKTTYFYPKVPTGFTLMSVAQRVE